MNMKINYMSSLEEISEPHIRMFFRGKSYFRKRLAESFGAIVGVAGGLVLSVYLIAKTSIPTILLSPALLVGVYYYYRYPSIVRKRIIKHINREYGTDLPCETSYTIEQDKILIKTFDTEITFQLNNLREVKQDKNFVELWFGPSGVCVIPKRVFKTDAELLDFIKVTKNSTV
jgi:hypothetical protein